MYPRLTIGFMRENTDPFDFRFGQMGSEMMEMRAALAICVACRKDHRKVHRIKHQLATKLIQQAKARGDKKFMVLDNLIALVWESNPEQGPPAPPPGVEMELTFGEEKPK